MTTNDFQIKTMINKDGRLMVPKLVRDMVGIGTDQELQLIPQGGRLIISPIIPVCKVVGCGNELLTHENSLEMITGICIECMQKALADDPELPDRIDSHGGN